MAEAIRMPLLSDTMKEGVIAAWHKKVGDKVISDEAIADVETDKATMEVLPYVDGTLLYVGVETGKAAKVNDIIAIIGKEGEDYKSLLEAPTQDEGSKDEDKEPAKEKENGKQQQSTDHDSNEDAKAASSEEKKKDASLPKDATVVRMPLLSDTMKEGKIVAWHKNVGDKVVSDDVLADVETDKATMEVMGYADGVLLYQGVPVGSAAKINEVIAIVGKEGTNIEDFIAAEKSGANSGEVEKKEEKQQEKSSTSSEKNAEPVAAKENKEDTKQEPNNQHSGDRIIASPLAKMMAKEKGFDLAEIKGSGDNGRVVKRDIESFSPSEKMEQGNKESATIAVPSFTPGEEKYSDTPVSKMRSIIAQRLGESKFSAPHFYLNISVKMDAAMEARKHMNEHSPVKISFNDLVIKACAMALRQHPAVNSSWLGDNIRNYQHIHIGTAVAVEEGLLVPVIRFADQKSLSQIATDANTLIDKARNKKLQPQEFSGNTFTISNLGMMDIDSFTAIINPPDAAILAVGKIEATPVVEKEAIVIRQIMKLTLSCDHRVVDGAVGARFLQTLKTYLQNPVTMLV